MKKKKSVSAVNVKSMKIYRERGMTNQEISDLMKVDLGRVNDFLPNGPEETDESETETNVVGDAEVEPDDDDESEGDGERDESEEEVTEDVDYRSSDS